MTNERDFENEDRKLAGTPQSERFPEADMSKEPPADGEKIKKRKSKKDTADLELLASDVNGTVGSRSTSRASDDIAGVADITHRLKR